MCVNTPLITGTVVIDFGLWRVSIIIPPAMSATTITSATRFRRQCFLHINTSLAHPKLGAHALHLRMSNGKNVTVHTKHPVDVCNWSVTRFAKFDVMLVTFEHPFAAR